MYIAPRVNLDIGKTFFGTNMYLIDVVVNRNRPKPKQAEIKTSSLEKPKLWPKPKLRPKHLFQPKYRVFHPKWQFPAYGYFCYICTNPEVLRRSMSQDPLI